MNITLSSQQAHDVAKSFAEAILAKVVRMHLRVVGDKGLGDDQDFLAAQAAIRSVPWVQRRQFVLTVRYHFNALREKRGLQPRWQDYKKQCGKYQAWMEKVVARPVAGASTELSGNGVAALPTADEVSQLLEVDIPMEAAFEKLLSFLREAAGRSFTLANLVEAVGHLDLGSRLFPDEACEMGPGLKHQVMGQICARYLDKEMSNGLCLKSRRLHDRVEYFVVAPGEPVAATEPTGASVLPGEAAAADAATRRLGEAFFHELGDVPLYTPMDEEFARRGGEEQAGSLSHVKGRAAS